MPYPAQYLLQRTILVVRINPFCGPLCPFPVKLQHIATSYSGKCCSKHHIKSLKPQGTDFTVGITFVVLCDLLDLFFGKWHKPFLSSSLTLVNFVNNLLIFQEITLRSNKNYFDIRAMMSDFWHPFATHILQRRRRNKTKHN